MDFNECTNHHDWDLRMNKQKCGKNGVELYEFDLSTPEKRKMVNLAQPKGDTREEIQYKNALSYAFMQRHLDVVGNGRKDIASAGKPVTLEFLKRPIDLGAKEQNKELEAKNKEPTEEPDELEEDGDDKHEKDRISLPIIHI